MAGEFEVRVSPERLEGVLGDFPLDEFVSVVLAVPEDVVFGRLPVGEASGRRCRLLRLVHVALPAARMGIPGLRKVGALPGSYYHPWSCKNYR